MKRLKPPSPYGYSLRHRHGFRQPGVSLIYIDKRNQIEIAIGQSPTARALRLP
jgi:hypothetical protein